MRRKRRGKGGVNQNGWVCSSAYPTAGDPAPENFLPTPVQIPSLLDFPPSLEFTRLSGYPHLGAQSGADGTMNRCYKVLQCSPSFGWL